MKADVILNKIREDAKDLSADILKEAKIKAEKMQIEARLQIAEMRKQVEESAKHESDELIKQMKSLNELELKKQLLLERRKIIDETFEKAKSMLGNLNEDVIYNSVSKMILDLAEGGETLCLGENQSSWFNEDFLKSLNDKLTAEGKEPILLSSSVVKNATGAVLSKNGIDTNCTLEAVLNSLKSNMENEVARILFNQEG